MSQSPLTVVFGGDSTAAERAAARTEASIRRVQVMQQRASREMTEDLAQRVAKEGALREKEERQIAEVADAERQHALMVRRAQSEMTSDLARRAAAEEAAARSAEDSARRQSAAYGRAGTALLGFGAVAGVALGLAGKAAIDWESDWTSVQKTVTGADDAMEQSLRGLTAVLPATHHEIAEIAAAAGALGVQSGSVVSFTKTMIDLGEATDDLDAMTAATELAQFMNIMRTGQGDVGRLGASIVALGNDGASTEGQIVAMAMRIASAGKTAKLSEGEVLGLSSALTSMGLEAEAGGSAATRVLLTINDAVIDGGENLQTFADLAGLTAGQFASRWRQDPVEALTLVLEGMNGVSESGGSMTATLEKLGLSDLRVSDTLRRMAGNVDLVQHSVGVGTTAWEEQSALLLEVAKRYETTESQLKIARNQINDAAIDIGNNLLPMLAGMADGVASAAKAFANLPGPVQSTLTGLLGITAAGALSIGAFLKIRSSLATLNETFKDAPGLARATSLGLKTLGGVAIAGGVVVALQQITNALHDIFDPSFDSSKIRADLIRLGATGKATGTLLAEGGEGLDDLRESFEKFEGKSFIDEGFFGFAANDFVEQVGQVDDALAELVSGGDIAAAQAAIRSLAQEFAPDWGVSVEDAIARITDSLPGYGEALKSAKVDAEGLTGEQGRLAAGADGVVGSLDDVAAGADGVFGSMDDAAGAMDGATAAAQNLSPEAQDLADKFGLTDEAASAAATALDDLDSTLSGLADKWLGNEKATDALQQSMNDLATEIADANQAVKDGVDGAEAWDFALDGTSDAALRNRDTMRDLIDENLRVVDSWDKTKLTSDELKDKIASQKQAFIDQMVQLGYSRDAVEKYAGIFDQIPSDLPLDIPITVHDQEVKDAKVEAEFLGGALKALEEPAKLDVDDTAARSKGDAWLNDSRHFFKDHTVGVGVEDKDARVEGERWLDAATHDYFVPHTVDLDVNDAVARTQSRSWLNDAAHFFKPHTVNVDEDDSTARTKGLDWQDFADGIFAHRTVDVDTDDKDARDQGESWLTDATYKYYVPHTVDVDTDDSLGRAEGEHWLTDAHDHYYVPHTVKADTDDSVARQQGLDWKEFADGIFGNRTVYVDVDVDIPYQDIQWLEDHLPQGPGGRMADQGSGSGGRVGQQDYDGGGSGGRIGQQDYGLGDGGRGYGGSGYGYSSPAMQGAWAGTYAHAGGQSRSGESQQGGGVMASAGTSYVTVNAQTYNPIPTAEGSFDKIRSISNGVRNGAIEPVTGPRVYVMAPA